MPGSDHSTVAGHFKAMKEFVKLLQDDLEATRMQEFQHPTHAELVSVLTEMQEQFSKLTIYNNALVERIGKLLRGSI